MAENRVSKRRGPSLSFAEAQRRAGRHVQRRENRRGVHRSIEEIVREIVAAGWCACKLPSGLALEVDSAQSLGISASIAGPAASSSASAPVAAPLAIEAVAAAPVAIEAVAGSIVELPASLRNPGVYDALFALVKTLREGVAFTTSSCYLPVPGDEDLQFLKVRYSDWQESIDACSADWQTSWHGALTPYILNIVYENGFRPPTEVGAAGGIGLFHSNNKVYPGKYAFPSPIAISEDCFKEGRWSEDAQLFCSMIELKVNPLVKCKGRKWHYTAAADIKRCVRISAVLFGAFPLAHTFKFLQNKLGYILMRNGSEFPF